MARFSFYQAQHDVKIQINFDREDVLEAAFQKVRRDAEIMKQLEGYLKEHFSISFNDHERAYSIDSIAYVNYNIFLYGHIYIEEKIEKVKIENTCLLAEVDGHLNIMEFYFNDKKRFFKLDKNRIITEFTY